MFAGLWTLQGPRAPAQLFDHGDKGQTWGMSTQVKDGGDAV